MIIILSSGEFSYTQILCAHQRSVDLIIVELDTLLLYHFVKIREKVHNVMPCLFPYDVAD